MSEVAQAAEAPVKMGRPKGMRRSQSVALHQKIIACTKKGTGMSEREIADTVGCDKRTVAAVLHKYGINQSELGEYKANRADIFAGVQERIVRSLQDEPDLKKVPYRDRVIALGVIGDKERLERGESTSNMAGIVKVLKAADVGMEAHTEGQSG